MEQIYHNSWKKSIPVEQKCRNVPRKNRTYGCGKMGYIICGIMLTNVINSRIRGGFIGFYANYARKSLHNQKMKKCENVVKTWRFDINT